MSGQPFVPEWVHDSITREQEAADRRICALFGHEFDAGVCDRCGVAA